MSRRRVTLTRIDPWSVLKFGLLANIVGGLILLLALVVAWYFIRRLGLVETACDIAAQVSIEQCGVDGNALFELAATLTGVGVVIATGIVVFLAFLANLIADLTGGIGLTLREETLAGATGPARGSKDGDAPTGRTGRVRADAETPDGGTGAPATSAPSASSAPSTSEAGSTSRTTRTSAWPGDRLFGDREG